MRLPRFRPMLPVLKEIGDESQFQHEIKWDGFRALAYVEKEVSLESRNGHELNSRFPQLLPGLKGLGQCLVLDGEIVALGKKGLPEFSLLKGPFDEIPLIYIAFDLLFRRGRSLCHLPWGQRRQMLEELLRPQKQIYMSPLLEGDLKTCFQLAQQAGLEGIVSKQINSPYLAGERSHFWRKKKIRRTLDCVVAGLNYRKNRLRSLSLALYNLEGALFYIGSVGSGLGFEEIEFFEKAGNALARPAPPLRNPPEIRNSIIWLEPRLVVEIKYLEMTPQEKVRHPVFLRLRSDKDASRCIWGGNKFDS
ncbi:MAG: hypothetical protein GX335_01325 [Firmicutes bacterium]|nr:hypothetical protein [Bacillota bacterium]